MIQGESSFCILLNILGARSNTTLWILSVKGGEGTPQIRYPLFAEKNRNLFFGPKSGVFLAKKTPFLALFEENFSGKSP